MTYRYLVSHRFSSIVRFICPRERKRDRVKETKWNARRSLLDSINLNVFVRVKDKIIIATTTNIKRKHETNVHTMLSKKLRGGGREKKLEGRSILTSISPDNFEKLKRVVEPRRGSRLVSLT